MSIPSGLNTTIILRLELDKNTASFGQIMAMICELGGDIVAIDVSSSNQKKTVRDITINVLDTKHAYVIVETVRKMSGVKVVHVSDQTFLLHLGGKIEMNLKMPIKNRNDLSRVYTPGVANVCKAIQEEPDRVHSLTIKRNTIAVISDGSAVLGLGNIGPEAAMPVMEGKAMLFRGLLDCRTTKVTEQMKLAAAMAIASVVADDELNEDYIIPSVFNHQVVEKVKDAVIQAAYESGVARRYKEKATQL